MDQKATTQDWFYLRMPVDSSSSSLQERAGKYRGYGSITTENLLAYIVRYSGVSSARRSVRLAVYSVVSKGGKPRKTNRLDILVGEHQNKREALIAAFHFPECPTAGNQTMTVFNANVREGKLVTAGGRRRHLAKGPWRNGSRC